MFQKEVRKSYDSKFELCAENGEIYEYTVSSYGKQHSHKVMFQPAQCKISCGCKKFEFAGILCSHILKVLSWRNITEIPKLYIMKRWTKLAKKSDVEAQFTEASTDVSEFTNDIDEKELHGIQYKEICSLSSQLVMRAVSLPAEAFGIAKRGLLMLIKEVDASWKNTIPMLQISKPNLTTHRVRSSSTVMKNQSSTSEICEEAAEIRGWKTKQKKTIKSGKRVRSGLEKNTRKKKLFTTGVQATSKAQQQHSIKPQGFERPSLNNFIPGGQREKASEEYDDVCG
ncbi:hypothetical protein C2S52_000625 [Perilla frutescens var. hirtella]|nr:hypothetical protein C2S52_000625 [Perilla frutescens var. hirtella]